MMKNILLAALLAFCGFAAAQDATTLKPVSEFDKIADKQERAIALFTEAGKVINSPRCLNCHPGTDRPTQSNALSPHQPWVVRGADGFGAAAMRCATCHQAENFDNARVPGHPKWHLAPASMAWQGRTLAQICEQIKDKQRNGGKSLAQLHEHMAHDSLVGWAWHPGGKRSPAPGTQKAFGEVVGAWIASGAHCPAP